MAVTLDTGALVLADKNDRRFWAWWKRAVQLGEDLNVATPVMAQAWRDGGRQASLSRVLRACRFVPMCDAMSRAAWSSTDPARAAVVADLVTANYDLLVAYRAASNCYYGS